MLTTDQLFNRRLNFHQYKKGYRFSIDSPLLANFVFEREKKDLIYLDIGTGSGVIPIIIDYFDKDNIIKKIYGIEIQEELYKLAIKNSELNSSNIEFINIDINSISKILEPNSIDIVFSNPPYYKVGNGRISPNLQKSIAKHELKLNLEQLISNSYYLLKNRGKIKIIYPIERFFELTTMLKNRKFGISKIVFIYPLKDKSAKLFLIEAIKGIELETEILPSIIIHEDENNYTKEIQELLF